MYQQSESRHSLVANAALAEAFARIEKDRHFSEPGLLHKHKMGSYDDSYSDHEDGPYQDHEDTE
jgi:hypothetical protein